MNFRRDIVWITTALIAPLFVLAVQHVFAHRNDSRWSSRCQSNLRMLGLSLAQYREDYDSRFPPCVVAGPLSRPLPAGFSGFPPPVGWVDALVVYHKAETNYICPLRDEQMANHSWGSMSPEFRGATDYWLNGNLAGRSIKDLTSPAATLAIGDGNDGNDLTDATYNLKSLPQHWLNDAAMPPWRHLGGANYLYVDGHVAWQRPDKVTRNYGRADCFAVR